MRFDGIYIQPGLVVALPSAMVAHLHNSFLLKTTPVIQRRPRDSTLTFEISLKPLLKAEIMNNHDECPL